MDSRRSITVVLELASREKNVIEQASNFCSDKWSYGPRQISIRHPFITVWDSTHHILVLIGISQSIASGRNWCGVFKDFWGELGVGSRAKLVRTLLCLSPTSGV